MECHCKNGIYIPRKEKVAWGPSRENFQIFEVPDSSFGENLLKNCID